MPDATPPTDQNPLTSVPLEITVSVGKARPLIRELLQMQRGAILSLDRRVEDPVELFVGDKLIARGMLEEQDGDGAGQLVVRLTEVVELKNSF